MSEVFLAYAWDFMGCRQLVGVFETKREAFFAAKKTRDNMIEREEDTYRAGYGICSPCEMRFGWGIEKRTLGIAFDKASCLERYHMTAWAPA